MDPFYTLLILAGGRGRRMGGRDKGLVEVAGKPLLDHLLAAVSVPPARIVISANRHRDRYRQRADQVVCDQRPDYPGPMAGLEAGLSVCTGPVMCLPCDLLAPPAALFATLLDTPLPAGVRVIEDDRGLQPLCLTLDAQRWLGSIRAYLDDDRHSVHGWLARVPHEKRYLAGRLRNLNHQPNPSPPAPGF